ncbi:DNA internalization-related competence protein ComEC/Rec2 [Brevibacillus sp. 179-C9.3 HS]|uniref:DNA internalization-related competence protein ComEC/Rec2 n=1 Tax=unclassified Brevibacillus TaxID=2684853 RepID=UPI0039A33F34
MMIGLILSAYLHPAWLLLTAGVSWALVACIPVTYRKYLACYSLIFILAGLYFYGYEILHSSVLKPFAEREETVWIEGVIDSPVKRDGDVARFFVTITSWGGDHSNQNQHSSLEKIALRVKLASYDEAVDIEQWRRGSVVVAPIRLSLPATARNPHSFDYAKYLFWQGVHVTGESSFQAIEITPAFSVWASFQEWQDTGAKRIEKLYQDPETAGYMKSLLLGLGQEVTPELASMYSNLGLSHILAISGLHVTLVSSMFMWCLERIGVRRRLAFVVTILFLIGYVLLVGASASAIRSGLMGSVGLLCQVFGKRLDGKDVWAGSLIIMLIVNPYQLWHVGFQLSFAVTLGLIIFVPYSLLVFVRVPIWIRTLVAVTVSAQLVSFPFLIYHFHMFSPVSWLVNLVVTPILSAAALPLGYIAVVLDFVHPFLAVIPVWISTAILRWIHLPLFSIESIRLPFTYWPHPSWWWLVLYTCFLGVLPISWKLGYHRKRDTIIAFAIFLALVVAARQPFAGVNEVRITFLDVGQGDSIVVEIGDQKVYLMDAGGTMRFPAAEPWMEKRDPFEVGKDVVLPFLMARGIEKIDRVIMTHGDLDHIGGLKALVPHFSFGEVFVNGTAPSNLEGEIVQLFQQEGVPILTGLPGQSWSDGPSIEWKWLHPGESTFSGNDASVVLQLTAFNKTVLFTGDIEKDGENQLVQNGLTSVDVLKVAHHGSKTSSTQELLAITAPKVAVISAGVKNRYGHPSQEVLHRLEKSGSVVYRTDAQGAITLVITPAGLFWQTQLLDT